MTARADEPQPIKRPRQDRSALRDRFEPSGTTFEALTASVQQLQGLARDRADQAALPQKASRKSRRG